MSSSRRLGSLGWLFLGASALLLGGCARVYPVEAAAPPPTVERPAVAPQLGVERELEERLATVEAQLVSAAEERRNALAEERLALTVALAQLAEATPKMPSASADQLLAAARTAVERSRARSYAAEIQKAELAQTLSKLVLEEKRVEKGGDDGELALAGDEIELLRLQNERETLRGRDEASRARHPPPVQAPPPSRGCAPGDPLCSLDDFVDTTIIDTPQADKDTDPKTGKRKRRGKGRGDFAPGGVAAARVAHEPTPTGVMRAIRSQFGRVTGCIPPALRQQELQLRIAVLLDERGLLRQPRVEATDLDALSRECVADVFRSMRIDDYSGSSRVITVPLWLAARE